MDLGDFNIKRLGKDLLSNNALPNFVNEFIKELSNYLQNNINNKNNNEFKEDVNEYNSEIEENMNLKENKTYVVSDISDNSINVVDIENGNEIEVFVSTNDEGMKNLSNDEIHNNIYKMDKLDFLKLNLTDNIVMKNNKLYTNSNKIEIKNNLAWRLLSDLYMGEKETEGKQYKVVDIKENSLYLTNADGTGGYFSIRKELYPNFGIGDIVQKNNREYIKMEGIDDE